MKAREGSTLGRRHVNVCGLPHPRPMFLLLPEKHLRNVQRDHWHNLPMYASDQGNGEALLHDDFPPWAIRGFTLSTAAVLRTEFHDTISSHADQPIGVPPRMLVIPV